ncbi:diguanylate cyclase [Noviherbaspirillum sp. CPCC 100848]|uniref:diguanylate cyclase n=1 Tax=Noviherbaspirillum album TaxID=3080276 RepID=A0ABU6J6U0_9BURK|nr:diguanylate cyclase [Noviherbaspirillum sp. CPCC 100848]MEC4719007.1 diguanylate cyclase [Noviherbaspirillum sp. CPCC 100848]
MSREPSPQDLTAPQSSTSGSFWERHDKFPAEIEASFQAEMDRLREHRMVRTGLAGALLYGAFAISDLSMVPDVYQQAWLIRFLIVIPLMLLGTILFSRLKNLLMREAMLSVSLIVTGASLSLIAALSQHPNAVHYHTGVTLIVLFGNIVLNQRFRSAAIVSAALVVLYGVSLLQVAAMSAEVRFNNWLFCAAAVIISLIANFRMDQDQRRAYLARLREQQRNEELSNAVELLGRLSAEDALTRLANRREFDRRLSIEWNRARRDGHALSLVLIDVDCFKNYNDHYGHPAGDACLQKVADALQSVVRRSADLVARFGGEEFVVLLPATDAADAAALAERMRRQVSDLQIPHAASRVAAGITVSLGVATLTPGDAGQPPDLVAAADAALYRAKEQGRNRVVVAPAAATAAVTTAANATPAPPATHQH